MRRSSLFTSTVVISVTLLSACTGADLLAEPTVTRTIPADDPPPSGSSSIYFHPLQGIEDIDGLYPIADLQDSPEGRRYGVEVWSQFNEDGTAVYGGGLVEYEYEIVTATERAVLALSKETRPALPPRERVGASLLALMDTGAPSTVVEVDVFLATEEVEPDFVTIEKEIARGNLITVADVEAKQQILLQEAQIRAVAAQDAVSRDILALGIATINRCTNMPCLNVQLTLEMIKELSDHPGIVSIGLVSPTVNDALIAGIAVNRGSQLRQYIDAGFDGEYGANPDVRFAIIEKDSYHDEHLGFKDTSAAGTRIIDRFNCSNVSCIQTTNFPLPSDDHATYVAGLLFGDLRDGQDPLYTGTNDRIERSGQAPESLGLFYRASATNTALKVALDHIRGLTTKPRVVNLSQSVDGEDLSCLGQTPLSLAVNNLFQSGTIVFKSASNTGHSFATDCTVGSPGAAIGAFTVGAHGNSWTGVESNVRTDSLSTETARGGVTVAEGVGRSIIDLTAFGFRAGLYESPSGYDNASHGTSLSTPTVAAAAIDFINMYKVVNPNNANLIDNPGVLFANMLLMGDRMGESGKLTTNFDSVYGAGRLMMRMNTAAGMDAPASWKNNFVCVGTGERVKVGIKGAALESTVNIVKAVIFWYDRRHGTGQWIDDIDLELAQVGVINPLMVSNSSHDNKERVFYTAPGNKNLELRIYGYNVTATSEGCGAGKQRVYYAFYYEDSQRDDNPEGPFASDIQVE